MSKLIDITGKKFGRLTVLYKTNEYDCSGRAYWMCQCDCGNTTMVQSVLLRNGKVKSCGCYRDECTKERATKHGLSQSKLYKAYYDMLARCYHKDSIYYDKYGGRGIDVCQEWRDSKESFFNWALSHGYKSGLQIDRIDNDKGYSPENCRFVTPRDNCNNRSSNIRLTDGVRVYRSIAECERENGYSRGLIWYYIKSGTLSKHTNFKILP